MERGLLKRPFSQEEVKYWGIWVGFLINFNTVLMLLKCVKWLFRAGGFLVLFSRPELLLLCNCLGKYMCKKKWGVSVFGSIQSWWPNNPYPCMFFFFLFYCISSNLYMLMFESGYCGLSAHDCLLHYKVVCCPTKLSSPCAVTEFCFEYSLKGSTLVHYV